MPPRARLRCTGEREAPSRTQVGAQLLQTDWIQVTDIYSFISLPNKKDFDICFFQKLCSSAIDSDLEQWH